MFKIVYTTLGNRSRHKKFQRREDCINFIAGNRFKYLGCSAFWTLDPDNMLLELPELYDGLLRLYCGRNMLTRLPKLPISLEILDCMCNLIIELPELSVNLKILKCCANALTGTLVITEKMKEVNCHQNFFNWVSIAG